MNKIFKKSFLRTALFSLAFIMTMGMVACNFSEPLTGLHYAEMEIENYGTIKLELNADEAPITVTNFVDLAESGFYDGLSIIRVDTDFVIQGGDGGEDKPVKNIKGEFLANGVQNNISHVKGTISMARSDSMDSASSQFFILTQDATSLDGYYAGFGKVIEGMDVIDRINSEVKTDADMGFLSEDEQIKILSVKIVK